MKDVTPVKSPNKAIDKAIEKLMQQMDADGPLDVKVKVISVAINWEKVKHHITESAGDELDESMF